MRGLAGRNSIVTGGASGIGRALCQRLGEEGCIVSVFDLNLEGAKKTVEAINVAGGRGAAFEVDIASLDAVRAGVAASEEQHGPTEILVNNAGWDRIVPFLQTEPECFFGGDLFLSGHGREGRRGFCERCRGTLPPAIQRRQ